MGKEQPRTYFKTLIFDKRLDLIENWGYENDEFKIKEQLKDFKSNVRINRNSNNLSNRDNGRI